MPLLSCLSRTWSHIQGNLFPWLTEQLGPLTETHKQVVVALEVAGVEAFVQVWPGLPGRPLCDRAALARAFVAKAVIGLPTTSMLIERLKVDKQLRRLCGWERPAELCSEATFSRAFAEFARSELPSRVHEALIKRTHEDRLVGHISRDATAIEAREKPVKTAAPEASTSAQPPKRKRGRPRKGEVVEKKEPRRLERQVDMSLTEMLSDLPTHCAVGTKRNAKGHTTSWIGYKLHLDVADGDIPISAVLTSASLHDSQVAIPLATMTASRVINLYDLMDSAYDAPEIRAKSLALGHVPIIDRHPRNVPGGKEAIAAEARCRRKAGYALAEDVRYNERSSAERVNGSLKDDFGGRYVRVRGHAKVFCHLMFGVLALTINQLMRLIT
ncbi:MAG TPA: transposase [Candidatus Didemnitutus sp.]